MNRRAFIILASLLLSASLILSTQEPSSAPKQMIQIPFLVDYRSGPCFGTCPDYRIVVLFDGTVYFDGRKYVEKEGLHKTEIAADDVIGLQEKISEVDFFSMDIVPINVFDIPYSGLMVVLGSRSKFAYYAAGQDLPKALYDLQCYIHRITKAVQWIGEEDWSCAQK